MGTAGAAPPTVFSAATAEASSASPASSPSVGGCEPIGLLACRRGLSLTGDPEFPLAPVGVPVAV